MKTWRPLKRNSGVCVNNPKRQTPTLGRLTQSAQAQRRHPQTRIERWLGKTTTTQVGAELERAVIGCKLPADRVMRAAYPQMHASDNAYKTMCYVRQSLSISIHGCSAGIYRVSHDAAAAMTSAKHRHLLSTQSRFSKCSASRETGASSCSRSSERPSWPDVCVRGKEFRLHKYFQCRRSISDSAKSISPRRDVLRECS